MPENTWIYDTVYEEFRNELQFTVDEMSEAIMFSEDRQLFDELMYRVKRFKWQDEQRNKWIQGEQPEYTVPEDCPFQNVALPNSTAHCVGASSATENM